MQLQHAHHQVTDFLQYVKQEIMLSDLQNLVRDVPQRHAKPPDSITPQKVESPKQFTIYGGSSAVSLMVRPVAHVSYSPHTTNNS